MHRCRSFLTRLFTVAFIVSLIAASAFSVSFAEPAKKNPVYDKAAFEEISAPASGSATDAVAGAAEFEAALERARGEYESSLASGLEALSGLHTACLAESGIVHAEHDETGLLPAQTGRAPKDVQAAPQAIPTKTYGEDDTEYFDVNIGMNFFTSLPAILKAQSDHTNVWVINDDAYHLAKVGTHDDSTCKLKELTAVMAQEIAENFDEIYERMTDPATGFGAHSGVLVNTPWWNLPYIGDIGQDGKINFVLYDINGDGGGHTNTYTAGYFSGRNYYSNDFTGGCEPIDMLHVDIGASQGYEEFSTNPRGMYSTLAHEFQHLLFFTYYGIYRAENQDDGPKFAWFDESLSELAATYYTEPDTEIAEFGRIRFAAANTGTGQGFSDFFTHGDLKSYGMEKLFAMNTYKLSGGDFAHRLYAYLSSSYPPASDTVQFNNNKQAILQRSMETAVGGMLKAALGSRVASLQALPDKDALHAVYSLFMETFASDGGLLVKPPAQDVKMPKLYTRTYGTDNLWGFRDAFGMSGAKGELYNYVSGSSILLSGAAPVPAVASGGSVSLTGYSGTASAPDKVSCEKLYRLAPPAGASGNYLKIKVADSTDTAGATRYYVALMNPSSDVQHRGDGGADIMPLAKNAQNVIDTGGREAWLFVSTFFRGVSNVPVYYEYASDIGDGGDDVGGDGNGNGGDQNTPPAHETPGPEPGEPGPAPTTPSAQQPAISVVSVVFDAQGGKIGGQKKKAVTETVGANYAFPPSPTRTGYAFAGWYTAKNGGAKITSSTTVSNSSAHTLYAHWNAKKFTVKFNVNKGEKLPRGLAAKKVQYGSKLGKLPAPKRTGYRFTGWYTSKSGGKKATSQTKMTKAGTLTLYAQWGKR
ncbi:MAG: InlB B-repeat-containing protein [Clostridiales Family XIII bacterium]|jgi:uncharacterized repeat protein (TIGR02543 family)|nr:InlB B-repeat-containing protein [Clostridiales Family XIII bacterium]